MSNLKSLRKNYFVSFPIQGSILARCAGYWFFYNLFLWHVMFAYAVIGYQGELAFGGTPRTFWDLYADFTRQHYTMLVCSVAVLPVLLWDAMHMSHRIAGPLVRLKNDLNRLGRGEHVAPIQLRKEDLLQDVIGSFNALLEHRKGETASTGSLESESATVESASPEAETLGELRDLQSEVAEHVEGQDPAREQILLRTESKWA